MKRSELIFSIILVPFDFLMILLAGLAAYSLRLSSLVSTIRPVFYEISFSHYFNIVILVAAVWLAIFAISGLYSIKTSRRLLEELSKIFLACSTGILFVIIFSFFSRLVFESRFIILFGWVFSVIFVSVGRLLIRLIQRLLLARGLGAHQIIVFGQDETAESFIKSIHRFTSLGYRLVERFNNFDDAAETRLKELKKIAKIDEVIQADPRWPKDETLRLMKFCDENHLVFKYAADLLEARSTKIEIDMVEGIPLIEIKRTSLEGWGKVIKRVFDFVFSLIALIILSPVFLIIAMIIKLDSAGPVFVKLERIGEKGRPFTLFKFRSMIKDAHTLKKNLLAYNERNDGPLFKIKNDPRITRIGRFIRRLSLDELPQFFNVLKGKMSLVGPRPHEPEEVERYERDHKKLLTIKPGMTGLPQIRGRSELSFKEEADLDIYYIENWSLKLDLKIISKTPLVVISAKSAS